MYTIKNSNNDTEDNLVRLHPKNGGKDIDFLNHRFVGVSPDIFIGLDHNDMSKAYRITRKFNISISVNPDEWSAKNFFQAFAAGGLNDECPFITEALKPTAKCKIHGDKATGISPSSYLLKILNQNDFIKPQNIENSFMVDDEIYVLDSIGVAANHKYNAVSQRAENAYGNNTSHFEIKFKKQSSGNVRELLCLNIHLCATTKNRNGRPQIFDRLTAGVRLFYAELGCLNISYKAVTDLRSILNATLDNYQDKNLSCRHQKSIDVLNKYQEAKINNSASEIRMTTLTDYIVKKNKKTSKAKKPANIDTPTTSDAKEDTVKKKVVYSSWANVAKAATTQPIRMFQPIPTPTPTPTPEDDYPSLSTAAGKSNH